MINTTFVNLMLILDLLLPVVVYIAILFAAARSKSPASSRVTQGTTICLIAFVGSVGLRYGMTAALPAAQFATWIPILNLGRSILMMLGFILIASAALSTNTNDEPIGFAPEPTSTETGNPYSPL